MIREAGGLVEADGLLGEVCSACHRNEWGDVFVCLKMIEQIRDSDKRSINCRGDNPAESSECHKNRIRQEDHKRLKASKRAIKEQSR